MIKTFAVAPFIFFIMNIQNLKYQILKSTRKNIGNIKTLTITKQVLINQKLLKKLTVRTPYLKNILKLKISIVNTAIIIKIYTIFEN